MPELVEPKIPVRIYAEYLETTLLKVVQPTIQNMLVEGWMARYWLRRLAGVIEYHYNTRKHLSA